MKIFTRFVLILSLSGTTGLFAYHPEAIKLYNRANENLARKEIDQAIGLFQKALKVDATIFEAHYLLGNIYYVRGQKQKAKTNYLKALALNPHHTKSNRYLGTLNLSEGHFEKAVFYLQKAHETDLKSHDILSEYGTALFHHGKANYAKDLILKNYSSNHFGTNYLLCRIFEREKDGDSAFKYLKIAHSLNPVRNISEKLAHFYIIRKEYSQALGVLLSLNLKDESYFRQIITLYLLKDDPGDARIFFDKNMTVTPGKDLYHKLNGDIHLAEKKYNEALSEYLKVVRINNFPELNEKLGDLFLKKNDPEKARPFLTAALKKDPGRTDIRNKLVSVLYRENKLNEALAVANKSIQSGSKDFELINTVALIYLKQNRLSLAKYYFSESVKLKPEQFSGHYNLGIIHYRMEQFDLSILNFETSLKYDNKNSSAHIYTGIAYEKVNKFDLAISHFSKALAIDSDNKTALLNLGRAHYNNGKIEQALEFLLKYLQTNPKDPETLYLVAKIYFDKKNYAKAEELLNRAISIEGPKERFLLILSMVYLKKGDTETTIKTLKKLLSQDTNHLEADMMLADIYRDSADQENAIIHYRRITTNHSSNLPARRNLILLYLYGGSYNKALFHVQRLKKYKTDDPLAIWAEGVVEYEKANYTQAIHLLTNSNYSPVPTKLYLGRCFFALGQQEESLKVFREIVRLDASNVEALSLLGLTEFQKNNHNESLKLFNRVIALVDHVYPEVLYATAEIEYGQKNNTRALALASEALNKYPLLDVSPFSQGFRSRLFLLLGSLYAEIREHEKSLAFLNKVTNPHLKKNHIKIHLLMAENHFMLKNRKTAVYHLDLVLRESPTNPQALLGFAKIFSLQKNFPLAIDFATRAIDAADDPHLREKSLIYLGDLHLKKSNPSDAIRAYNKALELNPGNFDTHMKLSQSLYLADDFLAAIEQLKKALKINKKSIQALQLLGECYAKLHDYLLATRYFEKVIDNDPQNIKAYISIIEILRTLKKPAVAMKYLQYAIKISRQNENGAVLLKLEKLRESLNSRDL